MNRYLDLYECIDDNSIPEKSEIFEITDFGDIKNLNEKNLISEDKKNEI